MKIAELKGDKTVQALAQRLLAESKANLKPAELAATLLRLNPHLSQINRLEEGTPILLPPDFGSDVSAAARAGIADELLRQATGALQQLLTGLRESVEQDGQEAEQAQAWLKSEQAKLVLREAPELKEVFNETSSAAASVRKEQAALFARQEKALGQLQSELAEFQKPPRKTGTPPAFSETNPKGRGDAAEAAAPRVSAKPSRRKASPKKKAS